jgi:signal transduction histidine kinase
MKPTRDVMMTETSINHSSWTLNVSRDSIDRRYLEEERVRVNERLALAITAIELGTWEVFPDNSTIWDAQTYHLYGRDPTTALPPGVIYRESLSCSEIQRAKEWLTSAAQKSTFSSIEFSIVWPDGQVRWIAAKCRAIQDMTGKNISLLGVNWDITEQKKATLAQHKHQRDLSELNHRLMEQEQQIHKTLANSLHDQLGQTLAAMRLHIGTLNMLFPTNTEISEHCSVLDALTSKAVIEVRDVLKRLQPPLLSELGLGRALESEVTATSLVPANIRMVYLADDCAMNHRWEPNVEYVSFMIAREAISNAVRHSAARRIEVDFRVRGQGLLLTIRDYGKGITPPIFQSRPGHLGLFSMRERANTLGANLTITSQQRMGTTVTLQWPKLE